MNMPNNIDFYSQPSKTKIRSRIYWDVNTGKEETMLLFVENAAGKTD